MQNVGARDRNHLQDIDRDHASTAAVGADPLGGDLGPAAGRRPEIDHAGAGLKKVDLVVDLDELVGGARAHAFALGARHVRIVELAVEPELRGERAPLAGAHLDLEAAFAASSGHGRPSHTPSARIISTSMPSRKPRSATRRRSHGKARRIASNMAQPASTRSARSAPMQGLATRASYDMAISRSTTPVT